MFNQKIEDAINAQINAELWSAYLYLSIASYCHEKGYAGVANWYQVQFKEEQDHAMIFYNYLIDRGGRVVLKPIAEVPTEWKSLLETYEETLKHEKEVTALINNLYSIATQENEYATQSMLKWFIDEQVEEEKNAMDIINNLKMIGDNGYGLYMVDKELATRTYTMAAPLVTPVA